MDIIKVSLKRNDGLQEKLEGKDTIRVHSAHPFSYPIPVCAIDA